MKRALLSLIICIGLAIAVTGCKKEDDQAIRKEGSGIDSGTDKDIPVITQSLEASKQAAESETQASVATEGEDVQAGDTEEGEAVQAVLAASDVEMVSLPEGFTGIKAETAVYPELRDLIIKYYEIPDEYLSETRYYYNYVDLDNDGVDEIFVLVMGPYTSGTGGSSALWVAKNDSKLQVKQAFTIVNTPVYISNTITNGCNELITPYCGGGAKCQYSVLTCSAGRYTNVPDGKMIDTLEGISGRAILANDIAKEIDAGYRGINLQQN